MRFLDIALCVVGINIGLWISDHWIFPATKLRATEWHCTASHREGPEHDQHDVCDQYSRKEK